MAELNIKTGTIVTKHENERIDTDGGAIKVVPIWWFLLDLSESRE
jgi:predicted AAA+ superfamily ATPase